ncbi:T9SS type A sorting domain-containing protein [Prevotella melaninogenica]|uniref:endo-beta-N-acetylglucosaminidase n=1 Tax=Prevotella melaninogenica TaxID=28132 RepID=UPI001BAD5485|nr:GEVED domain-containing protein [Prevotella melaninogenica]QUB57153.1 T9SS type A sorting domain-containing protein [Prevotella melaninogenica]QUB59111.1 T9SS type A sorting domain-containing protein [Prevotella melaninogenica]
MNKKSTLSAWIIAAMMAMAPAGVTAQTYSSTASTQVFDLSKLGDQTLLEHFAELLDNGKKYPTDADLTAWGIKDEVEFIRSHVRKRAIESRADRLLQDTYENRNLFMNIPGGAGKNLGGYPSKTFANDNFSMWNYTNLFGAWNYGLFQAPGSWADAAHRNGTSIFAGIKFFDHTTGGAANSWASFIMTRNSDGSFRYTHPIINCMRFLGFDGINYNWESTNKYRETNNIAFHKELYRIAKEEGFNDFKIMYYTTNQSLTPYNSSYMWGQKPDERISEVMLNYASSDFSWNIGESVREAERTMGSADGLYAGVWIVSMNRRWNSLNNTDANRCGICLWGEHAESRFWSYNTGGDAMSRMSNYQEYLERAFSGGNRNPLSRPEIKNYGNEVEAQGGNPPLASFAGLASWIPERTAISGNLPFATHFNTGNGERYNYKGKKTAGSWYNMSSQDVVPTYRWMVVKPETEVASTDVQPSFTNEDAYTGGAALRLKGVNNATATDVVLFKTNLTPSKGKVVAKVAIKTGKEGNNDSKLSLIVRVNGAWKAYALGNTENANWTEKKVELNDITAGQKIERIGLRVKDSDADYNVLVGKLELNDDVTATPANVKDLTVQVKEETKNSLSVKAVWGIDKDPGQNPTVYNDEANIDHFEILYKNGENGKVSEVGRTSQWATLVPNIQFTSVDDKPFIGVRSVSTDLKTYSKTQWIAVPRAQQSQLPEAQEEGYGTVELDNAAAGADVAKRIRYVKKFQTEGGSKNIDYTAEGPAGNETNYVDATSQELEVAQGATVKVKIQGYEATQLKDQSNDDLRYCMGKAWMDFNGDKQFNPENLSDNPNEGECVVFFGQVRKGVPAQVQQLNEYTFQIPSDAKPGQSRLRLVFCDAWFQGGLTPTGKFNKGFAIDFKVTITGSNAARGAKADTHDKGVADEPELLEGGSTNIISANAGGASQLTVVGGKVVFENVERAWVFSTDGQTVKSLVNPKSFNTNELPAGVYLVKMQNNNVIRTQKITIK